MYHVWNSSMYVVEVSNTNIFKIRLDKFWSNQDCKYLWKADLSCYFRYAYLQDRQLEAATSLV